MPSGFEEEDQEEVSNPLLRLHRHIWKTVGSTIDSLRQQAPGARMIGEFAVKHAANEAQKRLRPEQTDSRAPSDNPGDQQS